MGKFIAAKAVERIEWDFTGTDHVRAGDGNDTAQKVQGDDIVGTLREPTPPQVAEFLNGYESILDEELAATRAEMAAQIRADQAAEDGKDDVPSEAPRSGDLYESVCAKSIDVLAAIGVPRSLLEQLPPRVLREFLQHVVRDLQGEGAAASSRR